ncbi:valine--tRNA ligase [Spirochaeta africana]|uniref:Valine--tRNA ligase n=1 Tax=Spirochaeta africana (strain ATCC 700263 / DSM 8902 / Z-7692) TaxID=889378 RepID=H9ULW8_SPIAZ|nr:valine--tRNA ligase [Spirochaeta africana]AFG38511.1 valyl-tRNA synthetase [Spirochaeta africana DSM 8902]
MQGNELAKAFNPREFEDEMYRRWMESGSFAPADSPRYGADETPFTVVIPPPNVTGVLHLGHGLNNTLQDILVRYHRMLGKRTLWVPGTDHAGIATQNVVERKLRDEGTSREELGREKFLERTWEVKRDHHGTITRQLQKIGSSCDWSRERFTLDEGLNAAVTEVFVRLYNEGLIYRGTYLVNWSSGLQTALSDDEVEYKEVQGKLYHLVYPLPDGSKVTVATTRPETMLGDTAVAVHPEDERYAHLVGQEVELPLTGRRIPIIADDYVDKEFGTGMVKITPAHDPNDYDMAQRHDLEKINILNPDGTLNDNVPESYRGMSVKEARTAVVRDLEALGLFSHDEPHKHQVGHCYRTNVVIEPYLSEQWFVRMRPLAEKALKAWQDGKIRFYPKKYENTYTHWLENIRDWCISRQLWWGHRIPVWYDDDTGEVHVSATDLNAPEEVARRGGKLLRRDEDVLDTWFSSWLWPFSTLGWPEETQDLRDFFPTSALVTAYDIIFFWVARMIMASTHFMGEVPFRDIYITSLVRDIKGRKMSKSLGNGIDPLEIVDEYGADALKFTLAFMCAQGQDILIDKESFGLGSRFANKIWNATRYLLMNLEGRTIIPFPDIQLQPVDEWIYHRLNDTVAAAHKAMASFRFNDATQAVYEFFWNDFCDWYVEASKLSLFGGDDPAAEAEKDRAVSLLMYLLEESMRLLHPYMSFITEEIYAKLPALQPADGSPRSELLITARFPQTAAERENPKAAAAFASLQEAVRLVRTLRSEFTIPPSARVRFAIVTDDGFAAADFLRQQVPLIELLTKAEGVQVMAAADSSDSAAAGAVRVVGNGFQCLVYVRDQIDIEAELAKLNRNAGKLQQQLEATRRKLANENFVSRAIPEVVAKERDKQREFEDKLAKITAYITALES